VADRHRVLQDSQGAVSKAAVDSHQSANEDPRRLEYGTQREGDGGHGTGHLSEDQRVGSCFSPHSKISLEPCGRPHQAAVTAAAAAAAIKRIGIAVGARHVFFIPRCFQRSAVLPPAN